MELIILIVFVLACTSWILWRKHAKSQTAKKAVLDRAWRVVLDDPSYMYRRPIEERKHDFEEKARKEKDKEEGL